MQQPKAQLPLSIYTESNPNPNSLKFAVNMMLVEEGNDYDFSNVEQAREQSPLAEALFAIDGVERVFIMNNFVTLTKKPDLEWAEMVPNVKKLLTEWLTDHRPIMTDMAAAGNIINPDDSETVKKIKGLLDEYVRPAVESDGGAINFKDFQDKVVTVELRGSCSGCPSSTLTLKSGIENLLKRMLPNEVESVVAQGV